MIPNKACPIVLREKDAGMQILVFRHPAGDVQLVKGTIEPGEDPAVAAVRELAEESGLAGSVIGDLGVWETGFEGQVWSLHLCETGELPDTPDTWDFYTADDGGVDYSFFWHPLDGDPGLDWHPLYKMALDRIRNSVGQGVL